MVVEVVVEEVWENETAIEPKSIQFNDISESWYTNMKHYLSSRNMPEDFDARKRRALCLNSARYQLISGILYRRNFNSVLCCTHNNPPLV